MQLVRHTPISATVEPLVGREWGNYPGQSVAHAGICFAPGSEVESGKHFVIDKFGVWKEL